MTVKKHICFENSAKWFATTKNNLMNHTFHNNFCLFITTNHAEALDTRQKRSVDSYKIFSSALLYSVSCQTFRYSRISSAVKRHDYQFVLTDLNFVHPDVYELLNSFYAASECEV